jgi:hypothetical protein
MTLARASESGDVARLIQATDFLRLPSIAPSGLSRYKESSYKEWHHFLIHDGQRLLLINFSMSAEPVVAGGAQTWVGRLKLLEHDGATFDGDIVIFAAEQLRATAGGMDVGFGPSAIRFAGGRYELSLELEQEATQIELTLVPASLPMLTNNLALVPGRPLCWLAVNRLHAWGVVRRRGVTSRFQGAPAYHDHNWGDFRWGDDFTWEWGTLIARETFGLSMVRITDRARTRVTLQCVQLWRGAQLVHIFRDRELEIEHSGRVRLERIFKLPRVLALLHPDTATDVPAHVTVRCRSEGLDLRVELELTALAQILMPDELARDSITILNQCLMQATLHGKVGSETIAMRGPGVFEFIRQ